MVRDVSQEEIGASAGAPVIAPAPGVVEESVRLLLLAASFVALLVFALVLLTGAGTPRRRIYLPVLAVLLLWVVGTLVLAFRFQLAPLASIGLADSLPVIRSVFRLPCLASGR